MNILGGLVLVMWIAAPIMCMCTQIHYLLELLTEVRLRKRHVFVVHANPLGRSLGQHGCSVRRQQDLDKRLPVR